MIAFSRKFILPVIEKNRMGMKYLSLYRFRHHLEEIGWFRSRENHLAVDIDGKPLPWYTYGAISFLEKRVKPHMRIFEYGSGNSTLWWSTRVVSVTSVEHDLAWFDYVKKKIPSNVEYRYCELVDGGQYCRVVSEYKNRFDVIVIDGRDRINCAKNSLGALVEGGVIIWDNSDRDAYCEGYQHLLESGFRRLDFYGYGPINTRSWCTSIFYRSDNCLEI
ncbi:MAG: hypothetical protein KJZ93_12435 [Caldilineaceae bacterium]|nr:hypothetical protein [Caldilineaceae bacterium]